MQSPHTFRKYKQIAQITGGALAAAAISAGCTGQVKSSFRFSQQEQTFASTRDVNTKIDLLWVVDNSASMDINQEKLRKGFSAFAAKYMQPTWDIRVAVIPTDLYLANQAFQGWLNKTVSGSVGWKSNYVYGRRASVVNPSWNTTLINPSTGVFDTGFKYNEMVPAWGALGSSYALLLPGLHDGPIGALCTEATPTMLFYGGESKCATRDNVGANTGIANCLNPNAAAGELSVTQCVNTVLNNTVHSGKAIISTMPPAGVEITQSWTDELVRDFTINVTTGSAGSGSERGMGSVLELLQQNENTETAFFRKGSLRGIIFVSDEEDQTMDLPTVPPANFKPFTNYKCDQASLVAMNPTRNITGVNGYCCSDPANNCTYGSEGTSCASKTVDGYTYTIGICPNESKLTPVQTIKDTFDGFFTALDGDGATTPNYFVVSVVPLTGDAIKTMQASRAVEENGVVNMMKTNSTDRGDRYIQLGNLVANGSLAMNMAESDYSPILDAIGNSIIEKKSTFTLDRVPTGSEDMIVKVIHKDGSTTLITSDKFVIHDKSLMITDSSLILSLAATDKISINYQPKSAF